MMNKKGDSEVMWIIIGLVLALIVLVVLMATGVVNIGRIIGSIFGFSDCTVGVTKGTCSSEADKNNNPDQLCPVNEGCNKTDSSKPYCCYSASDILGPVR